jgi:hypothetical protein
LIFSEFGVALIFCFFFIKEKENNAIRGGYKLDKLLYPLYRITIASRAGNDDKAIENRQLKTENS